MIYAATPIEWQLASLCWRYGFATPPERVAILAGLIAEAVALVNASTPPPSFRDGVPAPAGYRRRVLTGVT